MKCGVYSPAPELGRADTPAGTVANATKPGGFLFTDCHVASDPSSGVVGAAYPASEQAYFANRKTGLEALKMRIGPIGHRQFVSS